MSTPKTEAREAEYYRSREPHSNRFRNDLWAASAADTARLRAEDRNMDQTLWITQAIEARLDHLRCWRCDPDAPPVPVEFRDLTGKGLSDWIAEAMGTIIAQHPHHKPVVIGTQASAPAPERKAPRARKAPSPVAANGDKAATVENLRSQIDEVTERLKPSRKRPAATPGSPVFMEPGEDPVVPYMSPEVPDRKRRRS